MKQLTPSQRDWNERITKAELEARQNSLKEDLAQIKKQVKQDIGSVLL